MSGRRKRPTRANKKYTKTKLSQATKIAYLIENKAPFLVDDTMSWTRMTWNVQDVFACTHEVAETAIMVVWGRREARAEMESSNAD